MSKDQHDEPSDPITNAYTIWIGDAEWPASTLGLSDEERAQIREMMMHQALTLEEPATDKTQCPYCPAWYGHISEEQARIALEEHFARQHADILAAKQMRELGWTD